jgi:hypothetical protein
MIGKSGTRVLAVVFAGTLALFLGASQAYAQFRVNQPTNRSSQTMKQQMALRLALQQNSSPTILPGGQNASSQQSGSQTCSKQQGQTTQLRQSAFLQNGLQQQSGSMQSLSQPTARMTALQQQQNSLQTALQQTTNALTGVQQQQQQFSPQQYNALVTSLQQRQAILQASLQQTADALTALQQQSGLQTAYQP